MKSLIIEKWNFLIILSLLFLGGACSDINDNIIIEDANYLDSLLVDAINSSQLLDFNVALNKFENVISEAESIKDGRIQVLGNINIGNLYLFYNAHEEALTYFFSSLDLAKEFQIDELFNTIYNNIGIVYSSNNKLEKAEEYFSKALALSRERDEPIKIAINLINLGNAKEQEKNVDQAVIYFNEAKDIFQEENDTINLAAVMNNIGNVFFQKKDYSEAKKDFTKALELSGTNPENFYHPFFQLNYGKTLFQFEEYDSSMFYLHRSLDAFLKVKNTGKIIESYTWLAKAYEDNGHSEKSIKYYNESLSWKDTLLEERSQKLVSEIQMKYELGKKEKEIEFLYQKSKQEKLIWGGSILGLLLLSVLLYYSIKVKNTNLEQKNIILEKEQELANLEIAKNQLVQEKLKQKLDIKNRELASKAMHLLNKNEILSSITNLLNKLNVRNEPQNADLVKNAKNTISRNINLDEQWEDFKIHFEEVHIGFFKRMLQEYPSLSQTDLRLSAYLLINLNNKEIAQISSISPDSVRKRKQRLREKLNISKDQDIRTLLNQYDLA